MEDSQFILQFLNSIITLICFLLNVIFMTALYNVRSQAKMFGLIVDEDEKKSNYDYYDYDDEVDLYNSYSRYVPNVDKFVSYENSYLAIAVLFSICLLDFFGFMITLLISINDYKIERENKERDNEINKGYPNEFGNPNSEERLNNNNLNLNMNMNRNMNMNFYPNSNMNNMNNSNGEDPNAVRKRKAMMAFFIIGQIDYLIEIIVLTVYHSKAGSLEKDLFESIEENGEYFTKIYRDLIIVGYIFLFIFIVFDLFTLVIACNAGERERRQNLNNVESGESIKIVENEVQAKKEQKNDIAENKTENTVKQKDENENNDDRYCEFFSNCIIGCCEKMAEAFYNCQREDLRTEGELKKEIIRLDKNIEDLEQYLKDLNDLNSKIEKKQKLNGNEMEKLHLPRCDDTIRTRNDRINITSRNNK